MKTILLALAAATMCLASPAAAVQVRFYPGDHIYAYDAAEGRDAHTLMIQNIAIFNDGATPLTITSVDIQLMQDGRVIDTRSLGEPELTRAATNRFPPEMWRALSFQFGGDRLLPAGATFATSTTLAPGEALFFGSQIFAYRAARDSVRVVVNHGAAEGRLSIRSSLSRTQFQVPLHGAWYAGSGPSFNSPHRWSPMEEFAYDLLQVDAHGLTHRGDGSRFTDYYAYGQPVFAAASGRVVSVVTDQVEDLHAMQQRGETVEAYYARLQQDQMARVMRGPRAIAGNVVVIDHGNSEFSFYAHLKPGSVRVHAGDTVAQGQRIGSVGSTGNSTEPHLHFQVCDGPEMLNCAGIPIQFQQGDDPLRNPPHAPQVGDFLMGPN
ncbi:MAG: M23 family metallopeptidase [Vitreimonas sp.]